MRFRPDRRVPTAIALIPPLTAALVVALGGCAQKSEAQQLLELRNGVAYTQYRRLSESGLSDGLAEYRSNIERDGYQPDPTFAKRDLCPMRVMLAYGALIEDKHTATIAESDLVDSQPCSDSERTAAASLRAVAYQRLSWPTLAAVESQGVWERPATAPKNSPPERQVTLHLALGYLAATEQRWDQAQLHIDGLTQLLGQAWLAGLPQAGLAFREGRPQDGLAALKRLSLDASAPQGLRSEIGAVIQGTEVAGAHPLDANRSMPRLVAIALWNAVQKDGPQTLATMTRFIEQKAWAPLVQVARHDADGASGWMSGGWARPSSMKDAKAP